MTARIIQIGKRRWLAGMSWNSFEDLPSKAELADDAKSLNASWYAVREGESSIQAGFCAPVEGTKSIGNLSSLAAMLADSREQPWLGIFKVAEGVWWYVAVRDGHAILPNGDVIGGEAEIFAAREAHSGYADWNYIEGDLNLLGEFIDEIDAKPTRIRSLERNPIPVPMVGAAAIVTLSVLAGGGYWWHQSKLAEQHAREVAMAQMRAKLNNEKVVAPIVSPLLSLPSSNAWLQACNRALAELPLSDKGWELDQVACESGSAYAHRIRREGATVAEMPAGRLAADGNTVDQEFALQGLSVAGQDDSIELDKAKLALQAWAQLSGSTLAITQVAPPPALPGAPAPTAAPAAPQTNFKLDLPVSPFDLDFSALPGIRPTKINTTETGWHMEGIIYGH